MGTDTNTGIDSNTHKTIGTNMYPHFWLLLSWFEMFSSLFPQCLEKFPVIQHFKFGSLLSIQPTKPWRRGAVGGEVGGQMHLQWKDQNPHFFFSPLFNPHSLAQNNK